MKSVGMIKLLHPLDSYTILKVQGRSTFYKQWIFLCHVGHPKFSLVCMSPGVRFLFPMLDNAGSLVFPQALRCRRNVQP